jgi:fructuronate reductase
VSLLSNQTLSQLPARVARPNYDRSKVRRGVVHLGPGAFHRAHQAPAFDAILKDDPRWGIVGVSLHSAGVRDALKPQDGLYALALLDEEVRFQIIGSVLEVLVAPEDPEAVLAALAAPDTEIVTLTITEKGYCLNAEGKLDLAHADIKADIATPSRPTSALGYLVEGLRRRRAAGVPFFAVISCDNLVNNGIKLAGALIDLARAQGDEDFSKALLELVSPRTMVDSITPATDDALRARVAEAIGVEDRWPIQREAFTQWVVEDVRGLPQLDWAGMGVTLTSDVSAFERAKLRVLNASHSALAYLGLLKGHQTVFEAVSDPSLAGFVRDFMAEDVTPLLKGGPAPDVYCAAVLKRFRNPEIRHFLAQIAWDGSQKLPNRVFGLIEEALKGGRSIGRPARIVAAWLHFLRKRTTDGEKLVDPLAGQLLETAGKATGAPESDVDLFLAMENVFPRPLWGQPVLRAALVQAYSELLNQG